MKKTALTIAGSDSIGGAGIQADIKTLEANGVYAMSVIAALTAQNTMGVQGVWEVSADVLEQQLRSVFNDVIPNATKVGMLYTKHNIQKTAEIFREYAVKNIVIDPVMVSTSGRNLLQKDAKEELQKNLFLLADMLTPNIPEAEVLIGKSISNKQEMEHAVKQIGETYHCAVVLKGGHACGNADDCLYYQGKISWFLGKRIPNFNTHGTGCTFSSAITAELAKGMEITASVKMAKEYMNGVLKNSFNIGKGNGPLNHMWKNKEG